MFRLGAVWALWVGVATVAMAAAIDEPTSAPAAAQAGITLTSPTDYQVFQRGTRSRGDMFLAGACSVTNAELYWALDGPTLGGSPAPDWAPMTTAAGGFATDVSVPAGGWYRFEIRAVVAGKMVARATVAHVGVGEVFVVAGQSNSTNYGEKRQHPRSGMVATFDGRAWRFAYDPQPGTQDGSGGGSFLPAFGDALNQKYHVPIGVASTGCGATSVRQWLMKGEKIERLPTLTYHVVTNRTGGWEASGDLFDGMMQRIQQLGPNGFRALLWHQGESDAGQARAGYPADRQISGADYRKLLEKVIRASRRKAGWDFPWFVAQATYHSATDPADKEFRAAQKALWDFGVALAGPDTDSLTSEYRDHGGRGVHFNEQGLAAHGQLWAEKVSAYLDAVFAAEPPEPAAPTAPGK